MGRNVPDEKKCPRPDHAAPAHTSTSSSARNHPKRKNERWKKRTIANKKISHLPQNTKTYAATFEDNHTKIAAFFVRFSLLLANVSILRNWVRNSLNLCSLVHLIRPPQIHTPQGLPPGDTSSASQARHLLLGRRLRACAEPRKILPLLKKAPGHAREHALCEDVQTKGLPRARGRVSAGCQWHPRQGTALAVDEVSETFCFSECDLKSTTNQKLKRKSI